MYISYETIRKNFYLKHLLSTIKHKNYPYQFAYKQGCSTLAALVHIVSKYLDKPNTHVRTFSRFLLSIFNTIQGDIWCLNQVESKFLFD